MNKNILIYGLGFAAIFGSLYFINKKNKSNLIDQENDSVDAAPSINSIKASKSSSIDKNKILKEGSSGEEVVFLQKLLGKLNTDGIFGPATKSRLKDIFKLDSITLNLYDKYRPLSNYVVVIHNNGLKVDVPTLYSFDKGYLKARAEAIVSKKSWFTYNFYNYDTLTGKVTTKVSPFNLLKL